MCIRVCVFVRHTHTNVCVCGAYVRACVCVCDEMSTSLRLCKHSGLL